MAIAHVNDLNCIVSLDFDHISPFLCLVFGFTRQIDASKFQELEQTPPSIYEIRLDGLLRLSCAISPLIIVVFLLFYDNYRGLSC